MKTKIISIFIAIFMVLTIIPFSAFAKEVNSVVFDYDKYRVSYNVSDSWANNQNVSVTITNTGDKAIRNWALQYDLCGTAANIWNGEIYSDNIIKNANYNSDIAAGESVNFGYTLTNSTAIPDKFSLCSYEAEKTTGFTTQLNIQNSWDIGFNGIIKITNTTDKPIMAWNLSFKSNFDILNPHNFNIVENLNNYYKIFGTSNGNIPAFSSIEIGFTGSGTEHPEITNIAMTESLIKGTDDSINYIEDENSDIGEVYFKEVDSWDNTVYYQDICFARNQLLLTAHDNVSFQDISDLADSLNASVVGYIELTNDYQIEFNEDVTAEYLNMIITELKQNTMIEFVSLNAVVEIEEDADSYKVNNREKTPKNWHLYDANIIAAWNNYPETKNVSTKIGLIDNYLNNNVNSNLKFNTIWNMCKVIPPYKIGYDFNDKDNAPNNIKSHGTHVAGIIAGKKTQIDDTYISGVCHNIELYGFALDNNTLSSSMKEKAALAMLIGNNVRVINVSMAKCDSTSHETIKNGAETIELFLNKLIGNKYDFIIVSSAGNSYGKSAEYNSFLNYIGLKMQSSINKNFIKAQNNDNASGRIIVVGSMKKNGDCLKSSNIGFDILAPGEDIYSTVAGNNYYNASGTSMATPIVAGIAGMIYEVNPNIRGNQVKDAILKSGANATGKNKKVDADAAIEESLKIKNDDYLKVTDKIIIMGTVSITLNGTQLTQQELLKKKVIVYSVGSDGKVGSELGRTEIVKDDNLNRGQFNIILDENLWSNINKKDVIIGIKLSNNDDSFIYLNEKDKKELKTNKNNKNVFICNLEINTSEAKDNKNMPLGNVNIEFVSIRATEKEDTEGSENSENSELSPHNASITSDELGRFVVNLPDGDYTATFTKDGYQPVNMIIQILDGIMYDNGEILEGVYLTPIQSTISGLVTEYNKTTKTTKPLSGVEVAVYKESEPENKVASTTTSSDGTYAITIKEQGEYIVKIRNEKQESISVSGGDYKVNATFEVDEELPHADWNYPTSPTDGSDISLAAHDGWGIRLETNSCLSKITMKAHSTLQEYDLSEGIYFYIKNPKSLAKEVTYVRAYFNDEENESDNFKYKKMLCVDYYNSSGELLNTVYTHSYYCMESFWGKDRHVYILEDISFAKSSNWGDKTVHLTWRDHSYVNDIWQTKSMKSVSMSRVIVNSSEYTICNADKVYNIKPFSSNNEQQIVNALSEVKEEQLNADWNYPVATADGSDISYIKDDTFSLYISTNSSLYNITSKAHSKIQEYDLSDGIYFYISNPMLSVQDITYVRAYFNNDEVLDGSIKKAKRLCIDYYNSSGELLDTVYTSGYYCMEAFDATDGYVYILEDIVFSTDSASGDNTVNLTWKKHDFVNNVWQNDINWYYENICVNSSEYTIGNADKVYNSKPF